MKGISPMIATVLLVGFTVAVGAILSLWFSTYTKTQTATVGSATACASTTLDVKVPVVTASNATVLITNNGPATVNITSVTVTCGTSSITNSSATGLIDTSNNLNLTYIAKGESRTWKVTISGCTASNVAVDVHAACEGGGITSGGCPAGGCS